MKAAWIALVLALLGGGAWLMFADGGSGSGKRAGRVEASAKDGSGVAVEDDRPLFEDDAAISEGTEGTEARLAKLEREVEALRRQVAMMKGTSGAFARAGSDEYDAEAEVTPALDEAVRAVIEEEREREREDEAERRRDRWEQRSEERLDELVSQAGINTAQRESISGLWSTEREKAMALFAAARSGDKDFDEAREEMDALRKETDAEAAKLLSTDQYTAYEELRPRGPGGRGGGGGGGGWGGGGEGRRGRGDAP
jgi:hypothetical protein